MEDYIMKNENEKKSITKSIKMSPQQEKQIREQAEKKNMKRGETFERK